MNAASAPVGITSAFADPGLKVAQLLDQRICFFEALGNLETVILQLYLQVGDKLPLWYVIVTIILIGICTTCDIDAAQAVSEACLLHHVIYRTAQTCEVNDDGLFLSLQLSASIKLYEPVNNSWVFLLPGALNMTQIQHPFAPAIRPQNAVAGYHPLNDRNGSVVKGLSKVSADDKEPILYVDPDALRPGEPVKM